MQEIVANVDHITFSIEKMLEQQTGAQALIFPGMDSKWYDDVVEGGGFLVLRDTWNWSDDNDTVSGSAMLNTTAIPEMLIAQCNFNDVVQNSPVSEEMTAVER